MLLDSIRTEASRRQIMGLRNACSGMQLPGEALAELYLVAPLYLLKPLLSILAPRVFMRRRVTSSAA